MRETNLAANAIVTVVMFGLVLCVGVIAVAVLSPLVLLGLIAKRYRHDQD